MRTDRVAEVHCPRCNLRGLLNKVGHRQYWCECCGTLFLHWEPGAKKAMGMFMSSDWLREHFPEFMAEMDRQAEINRGRDGWLRNQSA